MDYYNVVCLLGDWGVTFEWIENNKQLRNDRSKFNTMSTLSEL